MKRVSVALFLLVGVLVLSGGCEAAKKKKKTPEQSVEPETETEEKPAEESGPETEPEATGTEVECSAFAALKIRVTRGRCKGKAGASCAAIATSQSVFREAYNVWWSEGGECEETKLEEAALAIANACASVYTETIAQVSCSGKGFACGFSIAEGSAMAVAFAKAIAQAAVDAGGATASAFCVADVEAVSGAIAEASASAESKACVRDVGSEEDFQSAFVEQVASAIAEALVKATAKTCDESGAAAASSECSGEGISSVQETGEVTTTEKGKGTKGEEKKTQLDACEDAGDCCDDDYKPRLCQCSGSGCPWLLASSARGARLRSWRQRGGTICFCYPTAR